MKLKVDVRVADCARITGKPAAIGSGRRNQDLPPENLLIEWRVKPRCSSRLSVGHPFPKKEENVLWTGFFTIPYLRKLNDLHGGSMVNINSGATFYIFDKEASTLYKSWRMPYRETHSVQFRWDVFNVPSLTRFNAQSVGSSALLTSLTQSPNNFGAYTSLLTQPRVMQFALRYEF